MDLGATLMGLLVALVIKSIVIVFSALVLVRLFSASFGEPSPKLWLLVPRAERHRFRVLTWGAFFFFASELTCGVEIYILTRSSGFVASLHGLFSALGAALIALAFFQILDWKYIHLIDQSAPCLAHKSCGICTKRKSGMCQYRAVFLSLAVFVLGTALPVLFLPTERINANPRLYVLPFDSWNSWYDTIVLPWVTSNFPNVVTDGTAFYLPQQMLIFEFRILPVVSLLLSLLSLVLVVRGREDRGIKILLLSIGTLSYVYFEVACYGITREPFFGSFLHEMGELILLVIISEVLARIFPQSEEKMG